MGFRGAVAAGAAAGLVSGEVRYGRQGHPPPQRREAAPQDLRHQVSFCLTGSEVYGKHVVIC